MELPKKIINVRPAVIITAGLIIGILSAYTYIFVNAYFSAVIFCLSIIVCVFLTALFFYNKRKIYAFTFLFSTLVIFVGAILFSLTNLCRYTEVGSSNFVGVVTDIFSETNVEGGYNYSMIVNGDFLSNKSTSVYISTFSSERIYQGSKIALSGYFTLSSPSDFTLSTKAFYSVFIDEGSLFIGEIEGLFNSLKYRLLTAYENTTNSTYGLNYAIITGQTCYADGVMLTKYQDLGISHVFAVSGLHIGLAYFAFNKLLKLFTNSDKISFSVVTSLLLFYVAFCGFTASSLRAFVIITIRNFAKLLGEKSDSESNIALSAFIVLIINPSDLFSVGFLLSYAVYSGLLLLSKPFTTLINMVLPYKFSSIMAPCIVAQFISLPLLLDFFGYASPFSFLFNLIIIPSIAFIFPLLLISAVLLLLIPSAWIFGVIPNLFFTVVEFALSFINTEAFMISGVNFYYCSIPYYSFFYLFAKKFNFSKKTYTYLHIITLLIFILLFVITNL